MGSLSRLVLTIDAPDHWINSNQRIHRMEVARRTSAWRRAALLAADGQGTFTSPVRIIATIHKTRAGRWDAGNLYPTAKAIVDGLVDAGVLKDDSNEYVTGTDMRAGDKQASARVVIDVRLHEGDAA